MRRNHRGASGLAALLLAAGAVAWTPASADHGTSKSPRTAAASTIEEDLARAIEKDIHQAAMADLSGVDVAVHHGVVTLTGDVDSDWARKEAVSIVRHYEGVTGVEDRLSVSHPQTSRPDDQIESEIQRLIDRHSTGDAIDVDARVDSGAVTLIGTADSHHDKEFANDLAESVPGVKRVDNKIKVQEGTGDARTDQEIRQEVQERLDRAVNAVCPDVDVDVRNGKVELDGTVPSSNARRQIVEMAWVPGVKEVDDDDLKIDLAAQPAAHGDIRRHEPSRNSSLETEERETEQHASYKHGDEALERELRDAFDDEPGFGRQEPVVRVESGVVSLSGTVPSAALKQRAEEIARDLDGVTRVENDLRVAGAATDDEDVAIDDDALQERIEDALYDHPYFEQNRVHVTVDEGRVRLTGRVASERERAAAEDIVRGVNGVKDVKNDLTVSSSPMR